MRRLLILSTVIMACILTGCKPTENNYKAAYDAALAKRQSVDADAALLSGGHDVVRPDAPKTRKAGDRQVAYRRERIKPDEGTDIDLSRLPYAVAVAQWRMPTNARSQASALRSEGLEAFAATDSRDRWWTVAGAYPTFEEAAEALLRFADSHPGFTYIGLDGSPLVIMR
ncbi:MAG: SPOR domain-containing protein [Muribaculaceae bacterium]|nr:SPOR domain-containing protein [Muribaculaceae bacterium]